jgi:drug/metabolite transporter (DMT)-like permease
MTALRRANLALLGLLVAHTADHLARHPGGHRRVSVNNWVGAAALYASVATAFALADREDPRAPLASVAAGLFSFAGPLLAHSTSRLGRFSQPYRRGHADAFSWALLLGVAAAGAGVGVAGISAKCTGPDGTRRERARCVT